MFSDYKIVTQLGEKTSINSLIHSTDIYPMSVLYQLSIHILGKYKKIIKAVKYGTRLQGE